MTSAETGPSDRPSNILHDLHAAEHARLELEGDSWLSSVVDGASDVILVLEEDGSVRYANPALVSTIGYSPEDLAGTVLFDYFHPEDRERALEEFSGALHAPGVHSTLEYRVRAADGSWRHVELVHGNCVDEPRIKGVVCQVRDVTGRVRAMQKVRFQARLLDAVGQAVVATDPEGKVLYWNRCAEEVYGWSAEEAMDLNIANLMIPRESLERMAGIMAGLRAGRDWSGELELLRRDGTLFVAMVTDTPVYDEKGEMAGVICVATDITERKRVEGDLQEAEERYRALVERIPAIVYVQEPGEPSRTTYVSPQNEAVLGYTPEECLADPLHWINIVHPEDRAQVLAEDERTNGAVEPFVMEYRQFAKDGSVVWIRDEATPVRDEAGELLYWLGVQTDVTEQKEMEEALKESEQRFRASFEDAGTGMALVATDGRLTQVNRSLCEMLGYSPEELVGMTFQQLTHPGDLQADLDNLRRTLDGEVRTYQVEKRYLHKRGHVVWGLLSVSLVRGKDGEPLYFVSQVQDISGHKRMEERLQHLAQHDPLTGLPNRRILVDRLARALERARRGRGGVAALFVDLDGFKRLNDILGHESGDSLLADVALRLEGCLRPEDTLGRFGGDEFVVLLEDVDGPDDAVRVAERIGDQLREPFEVDGRSFSVAASVGIAIGDARTESPQSLLRDADTAMYRAKERRTGYAVFDPKMYLRAVERLELENDLRLAIERKEFVVHYQPIVRLDDGGVWGMEALVRWNHPERGLLDPDEFVPVAEERWLVARMCEQVLEDACGRAREWQEEHPRNPPLVVCVNLSAKQLSHPDISATFEGALERFGLEGNRLALEITESAYVEALEEHTSALQRIRSLGVRITIDDFGTGYSSLSYLKRLSADALKIDRSFIEGLGERTEDTAVARMVIELAHTLGLEVVAEGVERWSQAALLSEMGCDLAQGFYFAGPLPPEDVPLFPID